VSPAAMLGSTAPFADPGEVVVEVSTRQPLNAMRAFERIGPAVLDDAARVLETHLHRMWAMTGKPVASFTLSALVDEEADTPAVDRLADAVALAAVPHGSGVDKLVAAAE
jgi:hypothetical protein